MGIHWGLFGVVERDVVALRCDKSVQVMGQVVNEGGEVEKAEEEEAGVVEFVEEVGEEEGGGAGVARRVLWTGKEGRVGCWSCGCCCCCCCCFGGGWDSFDWIVGLLYVR